MRRLLCVSNSISSRVESLFVLICLMGTFVSGCSSSIFTGDKSSDQNVAQSDMRQSPNCDGLDLSSEVLSARNTKILVNCLNSNGSIQAYADLVSSISDSQLSSILEVANHELILNKSRFRDLDETFNQITRSGYFEPLVESHNRLLKHRRLIKSSVHLFNKFLKKNGAIDNDTLKALEVFALDVENQKPLRQNTIELIESALKTSSKKSYSKIVNGFKISIFGPENLKSISSSALEYFQSKLFKKEISPIDHTPLKTILWGIADGSLFYGLDYFFDYSKEKDPRSGAEITLSTEHQIKSLEEFLKFTSYRHPKLFLKLEKTFQKMDRPLSCMGGTKEIPNVDLYVINQMIDQEPLSVPMWISRDNLMRLKLASPLCDLPTDIDEMISTLKQMANPESLLGSSDIEADRRLLVTFAHLLKGLRLAEKLPDNQWTILARENLSPSQKYFNSKGVVQNYDFGERYRRLLVETVGDQDDKNTIGKKLLPGLFELTHPIRDIIFPLLALYKSFDSKSIERKKLQELAQILIKPRPEMSGKSVYDVLSQGLLRVDASDIYDFILGVSEVIESRDEILKPLLQSQRELLLINNANPVLDIISGVAKNASKYSGFFNAISDLVEKNEFDRALDLTVTLSENGKLKELLTSILKLFNSGLEKAPGSKPVLLSIPPLEFDQNQEPTIDLSKPWKPNSVIWARDSSGATSTELTACENIQLALSLIDVKSPQWSDQISQLAKCVNIENKNPELKDLLEFGLSTEHKIRDLSLIEFVSLNLTDLFKTSIGTPQKAYDEFGDLLISDGPFKSYLDLHDGLSFLFEKKYCPKEKNENCIKETLFESSINLVSALKGEDQKLDASLKIGAEIIQNKNLLGTLRLLNNSFNEVESLPEEIIHNELVPPLVSKPITACEYITMLDLFVFDNTDLKDQTLEMIKKYENAKTDQFAESIRLLRERTYWAQVQSGDEVFAYENPAEFKEAIQPLLETLAKPGILEATLSFFYHLDSNPYDEKWMEGWIHRLSKNVRPMLYYYPGTYPGIDPPQVRYVSQLDLLELLVIDADFSLESVGMLRWWLPGWAVSIKEDPKEVFALRYLSKLAQAGNNIQGWIDNMKSELDSYYNMGFESTWNPGNAIMGSTFTDELMRRLFNLRQIFPIVNEMNSTEDVKTLPDGKKLIRNDMGVLRDLFAAVLSATPQNKWGVYTKDVNSLSMITELVKFGLTRNIGLNIWSRDEYGKFQQTKISHLFKFIAESAYIKENGQYKQNPDSTAILDFLIRKDSSVSSPKTFDERFIFIGKLINHIFDLIKNDAQLRVSGKNPVFSILRRIGYDASLLMDDIASADPDKNFNRKLVLLSKPLLGTKEGTKFIANHLNNFDSFLKDYKTIQYLENVRSKKSGENAHAFKQLTQLVNESMKILIEPQSTKIPKAIRIRAQDIYDLAIKLDQENQQRLKRLLTVLSNLSLDPEFKKYKTEKFTPAIRDALNWALEKDRDLPMLLQSYFSRHMANGDLLEIINYIIRIQEKDPTLLRDKLKFLGKKTTIDSLKNSINQLRSGLQDSYN